METIYKEMNEQLILVDEHDDELGYLDKLSVHKTGLLHRAFSVFIFNTKGELLLQQRALEKYHSPGIWSNTCCSHPLKNESMDETISRRMQEEMGMQCKTVFKFKFIYRNEFENGLTEHELDHVYFAESDHLPIPNPSEVMDWKYINLEDLSKEIDQNPAKFSAWLKVCLPKVARIFNQKQVLSHQQK